jgi:quercetin dioxygenase-like cupin family protein
MRLSVIPATLVLLCLWLPANVTLGDTPAPTLIERKPLLTATIPGGKRVGRVEIKEIGLRPRQATTRHIHPCPVVGYVVSGEINFQIAGQPAERLSAGDAFYEPANTVILHFDATDQPTKFIVYYLLGSDETELIKML